ncbi:recombinase family protein [Candidatus Nomurabacteria bacterium]|nr:recombinase family protein [Candidatus Nomurabacteria bacterium]
MAMRETAVGIARVSSKDQEDGYSLDSQENLMNTYGDNHNYRLLKVFKIAESASKAKQRKVFREAMKFVEEHGVNNLFVEKVDRHARNFHDAVETHDWLMANEGRKIHFIKDSIVLHKNSRSQEWLNWGIRVVMAKNYVDNLREEAMKGWTEKLAQGWMPGVPPPGYVNVTVDGKRIQVPDESTWRIVKEMFELYLQPGQSGKTITKEMALRGVRTRKGRPYVHGRVDEMLTNPFYVGIIRWDGKEYPGKQQTFIDRTLWDRVQEKMHGGRPDVYKKHNPLFKNLITCSTCNGVVTWQLQKGRYYGACQRRNPACKIKKTIREDRLEETIQELLDELVCPSQELIDWAIEQLEAKKETNSRTHVDSLKSINAQIDRLVRMDGDLYDDKLAGDITKDIYQAKHSSFMEQLKDLRTKQTTLESKVNKNDLPQRLALLKLTQMAAELYQTRTITQKRVILTKLFSSFTYGNGAVSVNYSKFAEVIANKSLKTKEILGR